MGLSDSPSAPTGRKIIDDTNSQGVALGWYPTALSAPHDKRPLIAALHANGAESAAEKGLRVARAADAAGAA
jgi:hypothetical protein